MLTFPGALRSIPILTLPVLTLALSVGGVACAARSDGGAPRPGAVCRSGPVGNLLSPGWQQCWFNAAGGRWRTLKHELHYDSFVVDVEAATLVDAREIAQRFIDNQPRFRYLTLYVYQEPASTPGPVRRLSWSAATGFETLDYTLASTRNAGARQAGHAAGDRRRPARPPRCRAVEFGCARVIPEQPAYLIVQR
jgi:hypothetical protein